MKLEAPLLNLVDRCQTICVAECCGIDAYDFSPVHIASHLLMWQGKPNEKEIAKLQDQLESLRANYGTRGTISCGIIIDDMNQCFSGDAIEKLVDEIMHNLKVALQINQASEQERFIRSE